MDNTDLLAESGLAFVDYLLVAFGLGFGLAYWLRGRVLRKLRLASQELLERVTRLESQGLVTPPAGVPEGARRERSLRGGSEYVFSEAPAQGKPPASLPETAFLRKEISPSLAARQLAALLGTRIPVASPRQRDDLKRITGIGPRTEEKLHLLGFYTFVQIGRMDEHAIPLLTAALGFPPGRLQREDWVGQARQLESSKKVTSHGHTRDKAGKGRQGPP